MAGGVERSVFPDEDLLVLEVAHSFMEMPPFQAMVDARELLVFSFDLSNDGMLVGFELGMSLVVMVVALDLGGGSEVHHTDCHSQGEERGPIAL